MSVYRRGRIWWYELQFSGQLIRESSKSPIKEVAKRAERERRRSLELGANYLEPLRKQLSFSSAAAAWSESNPHWTASTREINKQKLKHLLPVFGGQMVNEITAQQIKAYQRSRQIAEASPRSINMEVSALRQVLKEHGRWAHIQHQVKMLREAVEVGRALSEDEVMRLEAAASASRSRSLRVALLLLRHTGMRVSELRTMRWSQVDLIEGSVIVGKAKTKSSEGRFIPLSAAALACLREWRAKFPEAKPAHFLFPSERYGLNGDDGYTEGVVSVWGINPEKPISSWKVAWGACKKAAGVQCRLHDLRHTFVSKLGEGRVPDVTLMSLTGHVSRRMLERYSHARVDAKRRAVELFDSEPAQLSIQPPKSSAPN